jgi:hypothetical protein
MTAVTVGAPRVRKPPSGTARPQLRGISALLVIAGALVVIGVIGAVISAIAHPKTRAACPSVVTCLTPGLHTGPDHTQTYTNKAVGYSFEYSTDDDTVTELNADVVKIVDKTNTDRILLTVVPSSRLTADQGFQNQHSNDNNALNLGAVDTTSINQIVSPQIGFVPGVGSSYNGVADSSNEWINDSILAATDGRLTVVVSFAVVARSDGGANVARAHATDLLLDSFTWHS